MSGDKERGFPDNISLIKFLRSNGIMQGEDVHDIMQLPEFQVFRIVGQNRIISAEEIEAKLELPTSLSMVLSNLQSDGLIEQSNDYRWKVSEAFWSLLEGKPVEGENLVERTNIVTDTQSNVDKKKPLFKRIADNLSGTVYIPNFYTIEALFEIPELEILSIIYQNQPTSTDEIEQEMVLDASVSLGISNLQADNLIEQTNDYRWKLVDSFKKRIDDHSEKVEDQKPIPSKSETHYSLSEEEAEIIEHKQLIKTLLDMKYFGDLSINQIMATAEFEILNIINSNSPISSEEIENKLRQETSLSMVLSNLSADNLIEQQNDYRWALNSDFRIAITKVKISHQEIMEQIKQEETIAETTNLQEESSSSFSSHPSSTTSGSSAPMKILDTLTQELVNIGYIVNPTVPESELLQIPEYEILHAIKKLQPVSSETLMEAVKTSLISLTLSNLISDGLVVQTNDYRYEISSKFKE